MSTFCLNKLMKHFLTLLPLAFLLVLELGSLVRGVTGLGINYGQVGNNLPPPAKVIELLDSLKIKKARIYDTNPQVLETFSNSGIELIVTIENLMLPVLVDPQQALQWVAAHVKPFYPETKITEIAVGNEIFTDDDSSLLGYLVPAIENVHGALAQMGLDKDIKVSTPNSLAVLQESYPPSAGSFKAEVSGAMSQLLAFLSSTKSPFWINAYPYFAYKDNPDKIPLDYALFKPSPGMVDPQTQLHYDNMLYAQIDAVVFAMAKLGFQGIEVKVSETGWPSKGDENEFGASFENAAIYNKNLLTRQFKGEGTPLRPKMKLDVYLFALFNEDLKPGPTSERNYGLYQPDGTMAYNVGIPESESKSSPFSKSIYFTSSASKVMNERLCQNLSGRIFICLLLLQFLLRNPLV